MICKKIFSEDHAAVATSVTTWNQCTIAWENTIKAKNSKLKHYDSQ